MTGSIVLALLFGTAVGMALLVFFTIVAHEVTDLL